MKRFALVAALSLCAVPTTAAAGTKLPARDVSPSPERVASLDLGASQLLRGSTDRRAAAKVSAPGYQAYVACGTTARAPESHVCSVSRGAAGDVGAFFQSNNGNVFYDLCIYFPGGASRCARDQFAGQGKLYVNPITSDELGLHTAKWSVNGQEVGSYEFRLVASLKPAKPLSPRGGADLWETRRVTLRWKPRSARRILRVQVAGDSYSASAGSFGRSMINRNPGAFARSMGIGRLLPGKYKWRVRSLLSDGSAAWSSAAHFWVLDRINGREARLYTRRTIEEDGGEALNVSRLGCRVVSRLAARCKFTAWVGDASYRGRGTISYSRQPRLNVTKYRARFRVVYLDEYCYYALNRSRAQCSRVERWG